MDSREQYIKEKGYSNFNNTVLNEYAIWLEQKLTETNQFLQLQQTGVSSSYTEKQMDDAYDKGFKDAIEKSYSEEEVLQLLLRLKQTESYDNLYDWFEKFKKKL